MIEDLILQYSPHAVTVLTVLAGVFYIVRKYKDTGFLKKTEVDNKIVDVAEKTGVARFLEKYNPFEK